MMYKQLDKLSRVKPMVDNTDNEWNDCHNLGERATSGSSRQRPGILLSILKFKDSPYTKELPSPKYQEYQGCEILV